MAHTHGVLDTDNPFVINPKTRRILNASGKKKLMKGDHRSEHFRFRLPRFVEGHDMMLCNVVEIHFNNISEDGKEEYPNMAEGFKMQISQDDENNVVFSWEITNNATRVAGILSFFIRFACINDDGTIEYDWFTDSYDEITVGNTKTNSQVVVEFYADIIHQWKTDIVKAAVAGAAEAQAKAEEAQQKAEQAQAGAEQFATNAALSEQNAADSESNAKESEEKAGQSETNAYLAQLAAEEAARRAALSEQGAGQSEQNALQSENDAAAFAGNAEQFAKEAKESEQKAAQHESNAKTSETNAGNAKTAAELAKKEAVEAKNAAAISEQNAKTSEDNAKQSEQKASTSEINAANSEQNAKASEEEAAKSEEAARKYAESINIPAPSPDKVGKAIVVDQTGEGFTLDDAGVKISNTATPGQLIIVKSVDENGKPTEWEAVDRTHWAEEVQATVLSQTEMTIPDGYYNSPILFELKAGQTYTVVWDDVVYECEAYETTDSGLQIIVIGNMYHINGSEDTGEPFAIAYAESNYIDIIFCTPSETQHTVNVTTKHTNIHKLPIEYMPNEVMYAEIRLVEVPFSYEVQDNDGDGVNESYAITSTMELLAGNTYTVNWDGVEYDCICQDMSNVAGMEGAGALGDGTQMGLSGAGEPFFIMYVGEIDPGYYGAIVPLDGKTGHTISIVCKQETLPERVKIPQACLIESVITSPNGTKYKIVVADDGTLSTEAVTT